MRPDFVADSNGWGTLERLVNRYDVLKRERLPMAMQWMDLEWRDHRVKMAERLVITSMKVSFSNGVIVPPNILIPRARARIAI